PVEPDRPPAVVPQPISRLVVIDPGHGGRDPGALGSGGTVEKEINLSVARMVADILVSRGMRVILTRADDRFLELNDRAAIANREGADLFVSIHADSAGSSARGFTIFVSRSASSGSTGAAEAISQQMASAGAPSRGVRNANFRVLVRTTCPAVLVELGFISNYYEARQLADAGYQRQLAEAIAAGIVSSLR
ncbi:MAG TPA: N-acetylmuramoyl-L-alanine amidase, partial [Phycisphaerae bacterium]|nr:N-acetylmuramoyl-L-alanine amidase [Phycisphaerae bacterium]